MGAKSSCALISMNWLLLGNLHQRREWGQMGGQKEGIWKKQFRKHGDLSRSHSPKGELIGCL